ncbi:MAG: hypothetical protein KAI76_00770, partial [Alphaproteobacteria bacterium]|nr:hypothetical protein [Alphaproteobacteria bacterium]
NVFIGEGAGATAANSTATTDWNTALGYQALTSLTSGNRNTAVGFRALDANTTGTNNVAIGNNALGANATTSYNTAVGINALAVNTVSGNTAMGYSALVSNTTGSPNLAIGYYALQSNTTGAYNLAIGYNAMGANTINSRNTAIGYNALASTKDDGSSSNASYNTALGYNAGNAGTANTTGTRNTYIGYEAQANANNYTNSTALGNAAIITASNMMQFGNSNVTNHSFGGTGALRLPNGTIAQQPACAAGIAGSIRYKTDATASIQWCNGTAWADLGGGGATALSAITAATATNNIANENYAQVWNWDTLAGGNALKLASTSTLASTDTQTLLNLSLSGANGTAGQTTYGEYISNTHTGTTSTNVGLYSTASGGTTGNYAAVFDQGKVIIGTTPSNSIFSTYSPGLLIMGQSNDLTLVSASSSGSGVKADIDIMRAGGSPEAFSILAAGDIYGTVRWGGYDGSTWRNAAQVGVRIPDAMSPGVIDMPSEMYFSTRGDDAGTLAEKMVLTSDGMLQLLS